MTLRRAALLVSVLVAGSIATLFVYAALFVVQTVNADSACESYPASVPGADFTDVRGVGFENSFLNLGGRCTYHITDGSVIVAREPGWWFTGSLAGVVIAYAAVVTYFVRRKGHPGWLFGLCAFVAPPLGLCYWPSPRGGGPESGNLCPEEGRFGYGTCRLVTWVL